MLAPMSKAKRCSASAGSEAHSTHATRPRRNTDTTMAPTFGCGGMMTATRPNRQRAAPVRGKWAEGLFHRRGLRVRTDLEVGATGVAGDAPAIARLKGLGRGLRPAGNQRAGNLAGGGRVTLRARGRRRRRTGGTPARPTHRGRRVARPLLDGAERFGGSPVERLHATAGREPEPRQRDAPHHEQRPLHVHRLHPCLFPFRGAGKGRKALSPGSSPEAANVGRKSSPPRTLERRMSRWAIPAPLIREGGNGPLTHS